MWLLRLNLELQRSLHWLRLLSMLMDSGDSGKVPFLIWVFHPNAQNYCNTSIPSLYRCHELQKKREYGDHVREVELASFTPLIFVTTGGMGNEALTFYHHLADLLSCHSAMAYSSTLVWLCRILSFLPLRSATMCIREAVPSHIDLVMLPLKWWPAASKNCFSCVQHTYLLCWGWWARVFHLARVEKKKIIWNGKSVMGNITQQWTLGGD